MLPIIFKDIMNHDFSDMDHFFKRSKKSMMRTDIKETKDNFNILIDMPGVNKDNISVELHNGYLNVSVAIDEKKEEVNNDKFILQERFTSNCSRSFYVGDKIQDADINAQYKDGVLNISIPKKELKEEKKAITIK